MSELQTYAQGASKSINFRVKYTLHSLTEVRRICCGAFEWVKNLKLGCNSGARHYMFQKIVSKLRGFLKKAFRTRLDNIPPEYRFINGYNRKRVERLCNQLIAGPRGTMLGKEILSQLRQGYLYPSTYKRLSRWINPLREEYFAQPIATKISFELFARRLTRID